MTCSNCVVLRDRVRQLERELGIRIRDGEIGALMARFEVRPSGARILSALYAARGRFLNSAALLEATGIASDVSLKSQVVHVRKKVGADAIESAHGQGYRITPAGSSLVLAALQPPELQDER